MNPSGKAVKLPAGKKPMTSDTNPPFPTGGGEMGTLIRAFDWSKTPLGPYETWSPALRMMVGFLLANRFPLLLWWGPDYISIYNDPYRSILGKKHPWGLGRPVSECWSEIWHVLKPLIDTPYKGGPATWNDDILLEINRNGFVEETHFTIAYSPVPDDTASGGIGGVLATVVEITEKVIGERRIVGLHDLGASSDAKTAEEACAIAARTLARHDKDVPFAALYLLNPDGTARLAGTAGVALPNILCPPSIALDDASPLWPLASAARAGEMEVVDDPAARFGTDVPPGPWADPPRQAVVIPIPSNIPRQLAGFVVAGVSARLQLDEQYRRFYELLASQIATAIANARAYEEERKRAEALAAIDRAKTAFFSNISHEFRTPLTLMLGPLEDALAEAGGRPPAEFERLELAHRNSLRLLKLVNTLLDFSRIEAGRIEASYEPVDLARVTADLASVFRAAIERAGMRLTVDCPALPEPVYVDREMWEKIVFNLLSNAFKFTFTGEIEVSLRATGNEVELSVRDTGTGIAPEEIPHLFERFYRIKGAHGRSYEGSGIGLALVEELVKLHGGSVRVESEIDRGSRFIVSLKQGKVHLPAGRIGEARSLPSTGLAGDAYVQEALRWLPDSRSADLPSEPPSGKRILLADDNADMRDYVRRLLTQRGHSVESVADGAAALRAARESKPDLILSDVMMPGMSGLELVQALRSDRAVAATPIILLSARAGEEARIEGMQAGADDYLTKPFSARELLIRVETRLSLTHSRHEIAEAQQRLAAIVEFSDDAIISKNLKGVIVSWNRGAERLFGYTAAEAIGKPVTMLIPPDRQNEEPGIIERIRHGEPIDHYETIRRRKDGSLVDISLSVSPVRNSRGRVIGASKIARDISQRRQAESTRHLLLGELNHRVKNTLATVQAIAQQTLRTTRDPADFAVRFSGRIQSLARVHAMLTDTTWQGADLRALIHDQLLQGPVDETRVTAWGPAIQLSPETTLHVALMLHELGTNSAKYGSLSAATGWVTVNWSVKDGQLHLQWVERGGPAVRAPITRGFGTTLIEQSAKSEGGSARMLCEAEGITWQILLALSEVADTQAAAPQLVSPQILPDGSIAAKPRPILAGMRFLVIEDEPLIALSLADTLETAGAQVPEPVGTEKEALQAIETGGFDGALLDANLHGRPVNEIAAALTRAGIPFLFVTGYGHEGTPGGFKHVPVVSKPFTERQLLDAITGLVPKTGSVVRLKPGSGE